MARRQVAESRLFGVGGQVLFVGSLAFIVHIVLRSVVTAGPSLASAAQAGSWVPINLLGLAGAVLVLLGLPAILPSVSDAGRTAGVGLALLATSWLFFGLFLSLYGLVVLPWLARSAPFVLEAPPPPAFLVTFVVALLAWIVGAVLVALPFIRQASQSTWVGCAVLASGILAVIGNLFLAPSGPASNLLLNLLSNLGPVLLVAAFGYLGFRVHAQHSTLRP